MLVLGTYLRRLAAAIAMAALAAFVLHNAMAGHAHAAPAAGQAAKVASSQAHSHASHSHDHAAHPHDHAGKDHGPAPVGDDGLARCDSNCCGIACAAALPSSPAAALTRAARWSVVQWRHSDLQNGLSGDGLRRPPRTSGMT